MGRPKHRPGRAGTWLEVKVRNRQRYLYERTRVYQGGKSHVTSKYLLQAAASGAGAWRTTAGHSSDTVTGMPIMLSNQNRYRAPPLAAKNRAASRN